MSTNRPIIAEDSPRRFQFGFWTLIEIVTGAALVSAIVAELRTFSPLILVPAFAVLLIAWHYSLPAGRRTGRAVKLAGATLLIVSGSFFLLPASSGIPWSAARRMQCSGHLKAIAVALHEYHDVYKQFPPAVVYSDDGQPMHSWRTLILPFLGEQATYNAYDFNQPWSSPKNNALAISSPLGTCPACTGQAANATNYFYVVGPGRELIEHGCHLNELTRADGASNTILVVESHTLKASWFEPRDLTMNEALAGINVSTGPGISSLHMTHVWGREYPSGVNVAPADGSTLFVSTGVDTDAWRAWLTVDGGEPAEVWQRVFDHRPLP